MRISLVATLLGCVAVSGAASAQQGGGPTNQGAVFLLVPVGGRAAALGQAAMADGGSSEAAFWNPAGLVFMKHGEVAAHHAKTFISNNTALSAYFTPRGIGVVGISAYFVDYGSQEVTLLGGPVIGKFSPKNIQLLASFARQVGREFSFGINYKLVQFRQDCSGDCAAFPSIVGTTHGMDLGVQYGAIDAPLRVGIALRHAGFKLRLEDDYQADPLPTRLEFGVSYRITIPLPAPDAQPPLAPGAQPLDAKILVDIGNAWGVYDHPEPRVGLELGYSDVIRLRAGYAFIGAETSGPSVGLGVRFGLFSLDFSRVFYGTANFDEQVYISIRAGI